jgi:hypothetical protein
VQQPEAIAVPDQDPHLVQRRTEKAEEVARERVLLEAVAHDSHQAVDTLAGAYWCRRSEDARLG